jgi:hypothetical protein
MSLDKLSVPSLITPSNNTIAIVYSSTLAAIDNFRYNVKVLDESFSLITEMMIYPDTNNSNYLVFDASMILSDKLNKLSYNDYSREDILEKEDGLFAYYFQVTEYLGTTSVDTDITDKLYTFKGVRQYDDYWDYESYLLDGITKKFLTNRLSRSYKLDEYGTLDMFYGSYGVKNIIKGYVRVKVYYEDGVLSYYYNNYPTSGKLRGIWTMPIGPKQINNMAVEGNLENFAGTPTSAEILNDKDNIDPTVYYIITFCDNSKVPMSEDIRVDINHDCYRHEPVEFLYLGALGAYETFSARFASETTYKSGSSEVKSNTNRVIDDVYYHNTGDRGRRIINKRTIESQSVLTGWLNNDEAIDLMELYNSTDVYILKNNNTYPVIITNTSYKQKTIENDRLFNYSISYDMAYEKLTNR